MDISHSQRLNATVDTIKTMYQQLEADYEDKTRADSFLWDHCYRVAKIALFLADHSLALPSHVQLDPDTIFLAGLLHDAGKFHVLSHPELLIPEETFSSQSAQSILGNHGWELERITVICSALEELYRDQTHTALAQLTQDSDILSKLGRQGLLSFISKWTLRGLPPIEILSQKLSIELTYAINVNKSMLTPQGRYEAEIAARWTRQFFDDLINQWREQAILHLETSSVDLAGYKIIHIHPRTHDCDHQLKFQYHLGQGVKCTKIQIEGHCLSCNIMTATEFCLPVLAPSM